MKHFCSRIFAAVLALCAGVSQALAQEGAASAPEPTVSAVWVLVFVAVFIGVCAWFGYNLWRNDRQSRANVQQDS